MAVNSKDGASLRPPLVRPPAPVGADRIRRGGGELDSLATVLRLIRSGTADTRRELEEVTGLGRAVVADRVATLGAFGLVDESVTAGSSGGRAPRRIRFRADAGHILVAAIGNTSLGVGLVDLGGQLLVEHHERSDIGVGSGAELGSGVETEYILERLTELFDLEIADPAGSLPWGIGLAVPRPVELVAGRANGSRVGKAPHGEADRGRAGVELVIAPRLGERFGVQVHVDNDAHLMALSELRSGRGMGRDDLLFLKVGTSVSVGFCLGGRVHRGANGYAGDIGHLVVEDGGPRCRCGNFGCLEAVAGGTALAREARAAGETGTSPYLAKLFAEGRELSAVDVGHGAYLADPFCVELLSRVGRVIGVSLAALVSSYDPSLVVVGGGVAQAGEVLMAAMRESLYRNSRSKALVDVTVVRSEMGRTGSLMGAGFAVADDLFSQERLRTWIGAGSPVALGMNPDPAARTEAGRVASALLALRLQGDEQ